jgi:hypothetical protein
MPLFKRSDADLVTGESPVRSMIPYLMLGRNESAVYHDQNYDITKIRPWLKTYNQHHKQAATLFHLFLYGYARGYHERPNLNRFVSGSRIYQRKKVELSFAAKKRMTDDSPLVTVKVHFRPEDSFTVAVRRIVDAIDNARGEGISMVDKELKLAMSLPGPLLSMVMSFLRWLDKINLMPQAMIDSDPLFASGFCANLGSVGLDNTYHHLYEYGTISLFAVLGTPKKALVVGRDGKPVVKDTIQVRWAFDERINDGMNCALAMRVPQKMIEDPEKYLGSPTADADDDPAAYTAQP